MGTGPTGENGRGFGTEGEIPKEKGLALEGYTRGLHDQMARNHGEKKVQTSLHVELYGGSTRSRTIASRIKEKAEYLRHQATRRNF